MSERDEMVKELKHLLRYYGQATHEFFDDVSNELRDHLKSFYDCLEGNQNSVEEYRKMVELLISLQGNLRNRLDDLTYLTDRMTKLLKAP